FVRTVSRAIHQPWQIVRATCHRNFCQVGRNDGGWLRGLPSLRPCRAGRTSDCGVGSGSGTVSLPHADDGWPARDDFPGSKLSTLPCGTFVSSTERRAGPFLFGLPRGASRADGRADRRELSLLSRERLRPASVVRQGQNAAARRV